jgi:hypothetical protein
MCVSGMQRKCKESDLISLPSTYFAGGCGAMSIVSPGRTEEDEVEEDPGVATGDGPDAGAEVEDAGLGGGMWDGSTRMVGVPWTAK